MSMTKRQRQKMRELKFRLKQTGRLLERMEEAALSYQAEAQRWKEAAQRIAELANQQAALLAQAQARIGTQAAQLATLAERN